MPDGELQPGPRLARLLADEPLRIGAACLRAVVELARARVVLAGLTPGQIAELNGAAGSGPPAGRTLTSDALKSASWQMTGANELVNTVAAVVPRIAPWLPWRSDCLVQALAAQHWLGANGIASHIVIGVDKTEAKGFEAHAWLRYGDRVITGGAVDRYRVLLDPLETEN